MTSSADKGSRLDLGWLRENMHYDPETGVFSWKKPGFGRTVGKPIGAKPRQDGMRYLMMRLNGDLFYSHRVAWFYVHGEWPKNVIDHIDGNRTNNAIANLREATHVQNAARRKTTRVHGPSRGVTPHEAGYVVRIHHGGKRHYLGYYADAEEAKRAYEEAARRIHGEFAHPSEDETPSRGDYLNVAKCEMCGRSGKWGAGDIRRDTTPYGKIRGTLCHHCWGFVELCNHDGQKLRQMYKRAAKYIGDLDVFDQDHPKFRADVPYVSLFHVKEQTSSDGKLEAKIWSSTA